MFQGGAYARMKSLYVEFLFDLLTQLPMKLLLPMVCPPMHWAVRDRREMYGARVPSFSSLNGGYLGQPSGEFMDRFRLLTSHFYDHFYVRFNRFDFR